MVLWSLNYTRQPGIGRTTKTRIFHRRKDAMAFAAAEGARGYLLRLEDTSQGYGLVTAPRPKR